MKEIQVVIAAHNRPEFLRESVTSALGQINATYFLTVSDNSTTDDVENLMQSEFPEVSYVRREPPLTSLEHFRRIVTEIHADYFMIFHDDDVMLPNMLAELENGIKQFPNAGAIGSNSIRFGDQKGTASEIKKDIVIEDSLTLAKLYCYEAAPCAFPSYVYKRDVYSHIFKRKIGLGKYFDAAVLVNGINRAPTVCLCKPLMKSRFHSHNDGAVFNVFDRRRLMNDLISSTTLTKQSRAVRYFRVTTLLCYLKKSRPIIFNKKRSLKVIVIGLLKNLDVVVHHEVNTLVRKIRRRFLLA